MKAFISATAGFCVFDQHPDEVMDVFKGRVVSENDALLVVSSCSDWVTVNGDTVEQILGIAIERCCERRVVLDIETCLVGVSSELTVSLLEEIERFLEGGGNAQRVTTQLLKAPLQSDLFLQKVIVKSLGRGLAATATLLNQVYESQPEIRRASDRWLSMEEEHFSWLQGGRQHLWNLAVDEGVMLKTLCAKSSNDVVNSWSSLIFGQKTPFERASLARVVNLFAKKLFPEEGGVSIPLAKEEEELENVRDEFINGRELYKKVKQKIAEITFDISQGRDANAHTKVDELIHFQLHNPNAKEYLVKSLCNIAKRAGEHFRYDFERECLERALEINPSDIWLSFQLADHYKRVGRFQDAIEILEPLVSVDAKLSLSNLADVYVQIGSFEKAMETYDRIEDGEWDSAIRGAKADLLRNWGKYDEAEGEYSRMEKDGFFSDRILAGRAEIEKRKGNLERAIEIYKDILHEGTLPENARVVYLSSLANVYLRSGRIDDALVASDEALAIRPFCRQVKTLRAAASGLLGQSEQAMSDLSIGGENKTFESCWFNAYVRGLLLLSQKKYSQAKELLVSNFYAEPQKDIAGIQKLGAAVFYLGRKNDLPAAEEILSEVPDLYDSFANTIKTAFQFHIAVSLNRRSNIEALSNKLQSVTDPNIVSLVEAIRQRNWQQAKKLEIMALLRLTA